MSDIVIPGGVVGTPFSPEMLNGTANIVSSELFLTITPANTKYYLEAGAETHIDCEDITKFPTGYKADIIINCPWDNEGQHQLPLISPVLKDTSDNGTSLADIKIGQVHGGGMLTIYKIKDADKFNWYLSRIPIYNGEVEAYE